MATDCIKQLTFRFHKKIKPVVARFDLPQASSDGGALLLKQVDQRLGLTERLAAGLLERRQPGKVRHELIELLRQRIYGIACGYPDCNDAARLVHDPIHKLLLGRDPIQGEALASQPTLSRFENGRERNSLYRLSVTLADTVIEQHRRRLRGHAQCVTVDLDPTDDPTHGQQEVAFFHGFYGNWCYLPVVATVSFNQESEQYLVANVLRPGNSSTRQGAIPVLKRLLIRLRGAFPGAPLLVRLDAGYADPQTLDFLESQGVQYVVALPSNSRLEKRVRRLMGKARMRSRASGQSERLYGETRYATRHWSHRRRVIMKAEVLRHPERAPKDNPRFVVTNLRDHPEAVYQLYCQRGDMENRFKELQYGLQMDRTSCHRFWANQFRLLLTAAAYVLMQELRRRTPDPRLRRAQVNTLRDRLIKLAAWVEPSVRRVVVHLAQDFPWRTSWRWIACAVGASPG